MINQEEIKRLSVRLQIPQNVVAREYLQHHFLSELYKQGGSDKLLFKGGTALHFIYGSPHFSEDLDFTVGNHLTYSEVEDTLMTVYTQLNNWGFVSDIEEAKKTTGGYLAKTFFSFLNYRIGLKAELSFRRGKQKVKKEISRIKSEFIPTYDIVHLPLSEIVDGKLMALLSRSKPRDWYDLYFLLKNRYLDAKQLKLLPEIYEKFTHYKGNIKKELKEFLPASHQMILKDFGKVFIQEIRRYL